MLADPGATDDLSAEGGREDALVDVGPMLGELAAIGSRFTGRLLGETSVGHRPAVLPEISGRAWITGRAEYVLDASDPFPEGFVVG